MLWAGTLVNRLGMFAEPFLALYLSRSRHMSLTEVGMVLAAYGAGSVVSQPIGGTLADRIGRRVTLTAGMLANAVALLGLGYARGLAALTVASVVAGLSVDLYRPAASARVADLVPAADRTRAYGLIFWAVNLGFSVAMVVGGSLARAGFTVLFWADAATCVAFGLLVWRGVAETLPSRTGPPRGDRGWFGTALRDPVFAGFSLIALAAACVYMQAYTTLPLAMSASGLAPQAYGVAMAANGLTIVVAQPATGAWLGRRDPASVLACAVAVLGLGFGLTAIASATWQYAACVIVWTVGEILETSVAAALVASLAPPRLRGRYSGVFGLTFSLGYLIAPLAGTRLLAEGKAVPWLACAGVCGVAAAAQLAMGPAIRARVSAAERLGAG